MTRYQALGDFRCDLKVLDKFLSESGEKAPINIVDPDQDEVIGKFCFCLADVLTWVDKEIQVELHKDNQTLPDEGNPGYAVGQ